MDNIDRFRRNLEALTGGSGRIGIAVSGGPDSMALLWLAASALPGRIAAATVDHGLRAAAADEALMVARWCANHAIPHATLTPAAPITGNMQSAARAVRYALLDTWRIAQELDWIATAHHADDQRETVLMRLNRGAGVSGLAGIRARNGHVVRPLLGWTRRELADIVAEARLPFIVDPSNSDPRYDRAMLRQQLDGVDWVDPHGVARSAGALAEAAEALDWVAADLADRAIRRNGDIWYLTPFDGPREIQRRLLLLLLGRADPLSSPPRGDALDRLLARLQAGKKASLGDWLVEGGPLWTLRRAPPRRHGEPVGRTQ